MLKELQTEMILCYTSLRKSLKVRIMYNLEKILKENIEQIFQHLIEAKTIR